MIVKTSEEVQNQIINLIKDFIKKDVNPIATIYEKDNIYPHELIPTLQKLGLFGITIPEKYGGMGLDFTTFAKIFEEISKQALGNSQAELLISKEYFSIIRSHGLELHDVKTNKIVQPEDIQLKYDDKTWNININKSQR